ncbi:hypothetical protein NKH77_50870 [Streptomyces sp. M19]
MTASGATFRGWGGPRTRRRPALDPHLPPRVVRVVVTKNGGRRTHHFAI